MVPKYIDSCQYGEISMSLREYEMVVKAAVDPTRVRILKLREAGELCGCQIVAVLERSQSLCGKDAPPGEGMADWRSVNKAGQEERGAGPETGTGEYLRAGNDAPFPRGGEVRLLSPEGRRPWTR